MRRWILDRCLVFTGLRGSKLRCYSTVVNNVERVSIRNGSSGTITIDLHNIAKVSSLDPLLIYLPPYSTALIDKPVQLPVFMQRQPTAVINYRWAGFISEDEETSAPSEEENKDTHLSWPAPIHDAARAYDWIVENLGPSAYTRRNIYLYGSYLGASLATSLALTETHPHARMGIRGCVAYNGIYNWTTFLPDHPTNARWTQGTSIINLFAEILSHPEDPPFQELRQRASALFAGRPSNLFDPFASPCLFFHTPGLFVPESFDASAISPSPPQIHMPGFDDKHDEAQDLLFLPTKPPRKSPLVFPPRKSTLKIPETLLLHSTAPLLPLPFPRRGRQPKKSSHKYTGNNFATHAEDLAALMRRSIDKVELKERSRWDDDVEGWRDEAARRVQVADVGSSADFELGGKGEEVAAAWLRERIAR